MIRKILVIACLALVSMVQTASAQVVSVRGGEHPGFSRLVFYFEKGARWRFRETAEGHELSFNDERMGLIDDGVFTRIPRTRIAELTLSPGLSRIEIKTACDCPARAFLHRPGMLVVDVMDSPVFDALTDPVFVQDTVDRQPLIGVPDGATSQNQTPELLDFESAPPSMLPSDPVPHALQSNAPLFPVLPLEGNGVENSTAGALGFTKFQGDIQSSTRVTDARKVILGELARATEQGLLAVSEGGQDIGLGGIGVDDDIAAVAEFLQTLPNARAETSFDRALNAAGSRNILNHDGDPCIPNAALAVSGWADYDDRFEQISKYRLRLVENLDENDRDAAIGLAKTYVFLTFGAEAISVLDRFEIQGADADILREMARIMDAGYAAEGVFHNQGSCKAVSALWAALAHEEFPNSMRIEKKTVVLSFSGLPLHLRRHLGPVLAQRFLEQGDADTALAIRDTIARAPGVHGEGFDFLNANINLELGATQDAQRGFEEIAALDGSLAPDALIERIDLAIDSNLNLPQGAVDSVAALAFEYRGTPEGARLARAYVLANIVENRFDEALSSLLRIETGDESESLVFPELWSQLALGMARTEDNVLFLSAYYKHRETLAARAVSRAAREHLAERLMTLGFGALAEGELANYPEAMDIQDALLAARVSISARDYAKARRILVGHNGEDAQLLLAQIEQLTADHAAAAGLFSQLSRPMEEVNSNWRAGNWADVAKLADDMRKPAAELMTASDPYQLSGAVAGTETGIIASNEARLHHSAWVRETLNQLLGN